MAKLLLERFNSISSDRNSLLSSIHNTSRLLKDGYQQRMDKPMGDIIQALCTAAVFHLGSKATGIRIGEEFNECAQSGDDLESLLTAAALLGNLDLVKSLLGRGTNVNNISKDFGSALQAAVAQEQYQMVLFLLDRGADVNYVGGDGYWGEGGTALQTASCKGYGSIVRLLLNPGYKLKTSGVYYEKALLNAARAGHTDLVQFLFENGTFGNLETVQCKVLRLSSSFGHQALVQMMLDQGLDVNVEDIGGVRALESAAFNGHASIVSLLIENGAALTFNGSGLDAINGAAAYGHIKVAEILLDHGADINSVECMGWPPLLEAAKYEQVSMMRLLIDRGADLEVVGCGEYAFSRAVNRGNEEEVRILVEAGVNINGPPEYSETEPAPILSAMMHGQDRMVKTLLELGAKMVDPLQSKWAEKFRDGTYPSRPRTPPLLKP